MSRGVPGKMYRGRAGRGFKSDVRGPSAVRSKASWERVTWDPQAEKHYLPITSLVAIINDALSSKITEL